MEFLQLKYFRELAKIENLKKTSEKINISIPALSASISKLEKELNCALFDRTPGKALKLNANGRILFLACERITDILDNACAEISHSNASAGNRLNIGALSPVVLQDCLIAFRKLFPDAFLLNNYLDLWHLQNLDLIKKFDLIITAPGDILPDIAQEMHSEVLYSNDYPMLLVYPEHPFAGQESVAISDLVGQPFIAVNKNLSSRTMFDDFFRQINITPTIIYEVDHYMRDKMVLEKQGIGFSTYQGKRANPRSHLVYVPMKNHNFRRQQAIWWYKQRPLSLIAREFKSFAIKFYENNTSIPE